jgi:hypothetical protein
VLRDKVAHAFTLKSFRKKISLVYTSLCLPICLSLLLSSIYHLSLSHLLIYLLKANAVTPQVWDLGEAHTGILCTIHPFSKSEIMTK